MAYWSLLQAEHSPGSPGDTAKKIRRKLPQIPPGVEPVQIRRGLKTKSKSDVKPPPVAAKPKTARSRSLPTGDNRTDEVTPKAAVKDIIANFEKGTKEQKEVVTREGKKSSGKPSADSNRTQAVSKPNVSNKTRQEQTKPAQTTVRVKKEPPATAAKPKLDPNRISKSEAARAGSGIKADNDRQLPPKSENGRLPVKADNERSGVANKSLRTGPASSTPRLGRSDSTGSQRPTNGAVKLTRAHSTGSSKLQRSDSSESTSSTGSTSSRLIRMDSDGTATVIRRPKGKAPPPPSQPAKPSPKKRKAPQPPKVEEVVSIHGLEVRLGEQSKCSAITSSAILNEVTRLCSCWWPCTAICWNRHTDD